MFKNIFGLLLITTFFVNENLLCQSNDSLKNYSLEDIVVTATKFIIDKKSSPTKIEIIDTKQISKSNGSRLPDVLNNSPIVFIKSYGSTPALKTISLNGLGAEHTLILIDGVKINSFQNGLIDLSLIPKENIERIEIVNNGMSSIYGSDAIGGTINIITNNNPPNKIESISIKGDLGYGSFNTSRFGLTLNKHFKNLNLSGFYNKETSDGNFAYYFHNGNISELKNRDNAAYKLYDAGLNSQFISDTSTILKFYTTYSYQDKQVPGIETGTPSSKTNQKDRNWNSIFSYEKIFSRQVALKSNLNFQNNLMNYEIKPFIRSYYKNIVASAAPEILLKVANTEITTGYNFVYAQLKSNEVENNPERIQNSFFISVGSELLKNLMTYSSVRFDNFSDLKKNVLTARLGINLKPFSDYNFNLRANVGNNFRAPTFNDLYWKESGNQNLRPERSLNFEAGLISEIKLIIPLEFDFTYTYINANDKIVWLPQSNQLWKPINIASSVSNNYLFTLSFIKKFNENFYLRINSGLNLVNSRKTSESFPGDPTKDKYLPYLPLQSLKIGLMIEHKIFDFNLYYTHTGKRFSDFENEKPMNPFNIIDANISLKLLIWDLTTTLKFETNNLTNTDYQTISGYPMPLKNYFLTLSINY